MENIIALTGATSVLVMIPGPNVALIVANSLKHGRKSGLLTVAGTTAGLAIQLLLVVVGLAALIELAASALTWIRWLGVAYLVYLGIRTWNQATGKDPVALRQSPVRTFSHGLGLAVLNPKTLIFNAAFLPQFVNDGSTASGQLALLSLVFLAVVAVGDSCWVLFANAARRWLVRLGDWHDRLTGGVLIGAGIGLALSNK